VPHRCLRPIELGEVVAEEAEDLLFLAGVAAFILQPLDADAQLAVTMLRRGNAFCNIGKRTTIVEHGATLTKCDPEAQVTEENKADKTFTVHVRESTNVANHSC
jgi:hypothetical protein